MNNLLVYNTTITPLAENGSFVGTWESVDDEGSVTAAVLSSHDGTMYMQFSDHPRDTALFQRPIPVKANISATGRMSVTRKYFRVVYQNGDSQQTSFSLQCLKGSQPNLTSSLNSIIPFSSDATVTRSIGEEVTLALGLFDGVDIVNKFGRNQDVDTGTVPEDVWGGGGTYTGFPTGSPEEFQVLSSSASDTGVLTFTYLASNTSEEYQTATVTLNGTTPVNTGVIGYRMHTANYNSGSSTTFNVGNITLRHRTTTANVFCVMPIGASQTYVSGYTVPFGCTGYIRRLFCRVFSNTAGSIEGALYVRTNGGSPRLRRPFSASNTDAFEEYPYGGLQIPSMADIIVRITAASTTNLEVIAGYDLVCVENP